MIARLDQRLWFPDPRMARRDGLVGVGGDLSVQRLLLAYRSGVFPWSADPVTWWSPDPRGIFEFDRFHIPRSLERTLRKGAYHVTFDQDFQGVIRGCAAAPRREGETWISPRFIEAYEELFAAGHSHSAECWLGETLVGGVYGVAVGGLFAGESMFHRAADASKIALVHLVQHIQKQGFTLFDIQMLTNVTRSLGGVEVRRDDYLMRLASAVAAQCHF
jgi:leucyl/phenylalanyl-tRNA--protein transferase